MSSNRSDTRSTKRTTKGPARWTSANIHPAVFYGVFAGLSLLGLCLVLNRHFPWATGEHPRFYWSSWAAAGPAALIFSAVILWLDRYEREPWRLLLVAFLWGGLGTRAILHPTVRFLRELRVAPIAQKVGEFQGNYAQAHRVSIPAGVVSGVMSVTLEAAEVGELDEAQTQYIWDEVTDYVRAYRRSHPPDIPPTFVWGEEIELEGEVKERPGVVNVTEGAIEASEVGPFLEEMSKAVVLFFILLLLPHEFDGVLDGLVYGALVGLGFAMVENVQYLYKVQVNPADGLTACEAFLSTATIRIFFHGLTGHAMYTGLTGAGLGLARTQRRRWLRWSGPPLLFGLAVLAHMLWNSLPTPEWWEHTFIDDSGFAEVAVGSFTRLLLISGPFLAVLLYILLANRQRERKALADFEPSAGITPYTRTDILLHRPQRLGAQWRAFREQGLAGWRTSVRLQRILIEWALVRQRWAEGHVAEGLDVQQIECRYQDRATALARMLNR